MWIEQCAKAFSLHPMRWNNCAVSANDRVRPQLARTLLKTFRRRSHQPVPRCASSWLATASYATCSLC